MTTPPTELVVFAVGAACLTAGIVGTLWLVHRPARREWAEDKQRAVDAAHWVTQQATQAHLRREWRKTAKLRLELRETKAELDEKTRACAVHTEQWDWQYALPTIDGNRADILDAIDNLGIGVVLSCADPIDPPIAAEARAAARAVVVPIEAGRR